MFSVSPSSSSSSGASSPSSHSRRKPTDSTDNRDNTTEKRYINNTDGINSADYRGNQQQSMQQHSTYTAAPHNDRQLTLTTSTTTGGALNSLNNAISSMVIRNFYHGPLVPSERSANYYKHLLEVASNYEQFCTASLHLDQLEGNETWKETVESNLYDYELISGRLQQLRKARESADISSMIFLLRTSLSRNLGDMGNPELYTKSRVGTKRLIEDYIDEVVKQLIYICDSPDTADNTLDNKLDFFRNTRQYFGRTALLLSGGATLGLNHVGVIKALHECHLLPRIISGSSVGSIIAALVCSKTDSELFDFLHDESVEFNAFESPEEEGKLFYKISRLVKHGVLFDVEVLKECVQSNIGDVTFQEAYNRTRRILNITVSSSTKYEMPRLLNYLTAPNVLIWSAVAASCAIPFVYKSAPLMARDKQGNIVPWNTSGHRWIDGSVENDLPMLRLSELFNVNHFIVSQVNPHVVPFLSKSASPSPFYRVISGAFFLLKSEIQHRLHQLIELDILPTTLHRLENVLAQKYHGDITIVPEVRFRDYLQLISNPSREFLWDSVMRGERATWPKISLIRNRCQIEMTLDEMMYTLRCRKLDESLLMYAAADNGGGDSPLSAADQRKSHTLLRGTAFSNQELSAMANRQANVMAMIDGDAESNISRVLPSSGSNSGSGGGGGVTEVHLLRSLSVGKNLSKRGQLMPLTKLSPPSANKNSTGNGASSASNDSIFSSLIARGGEAPVTVEQRRLTKRPSIDPDESDSNGA